MPKPTTKKCKQCKMIIPAKAKVCPNCQKKQSGALKWAVIGFVCIALCIPAAANSDADTSNSLDVAAISASNSQAPETPTSEPTAAPTSEPTATPTPEPMAAPTSKPTAAPAPEPTTAPTSEPTAAPTSEPTATPAPEPTTAPTSEPTAAPADNNSTSNNLNAHDNPEQQHTNKTYVLNTDTKKIHHPSCRVVKKIAQENYATSSESLEDLIANGYTTCGICFK